MIIGQLLAVDSGPRAPRRKTGLEHQTATQLKSNKLMGSDKAYRLFPIRTLVKALGSSSAPDWLLRVWH